MRLKQILIAIDQLANAVIGGMADETMSARLWRTQSPLYPVIDAIFFWDRQGPKRHCQLSYESELLRSQLPHSYRGVL